MVHPMRLFEHSSQHRESFKRYLFMLPDYPAQSFNHSCETSPYLCDLALFPQVEERISDRLLSDDSGQSLVDGFDGNIDFKSIVCTFKETYSYSKVYLTVAKNVYTHLLLDRESLLGVQVELFPGFGRLSFQFSGYQSL